MLTTLLLAAALQAAPVPSDTPVNLAITLRLTHPDELAALQKAQQDPRSGEFRRWLTPQEFGARFGQSEETYREATRWFEAAGFKVTTAPNRAFFQALGTAGQVQQLLKVKLTRVEGQPAAIASAPKPMHAIPAAMTMRGPRILVRKPTNWDTTTKLSDIGSSSRPAMSGVAPRIV